MSEIPQRGRLGRRFLRLAGAALAAGLVTAMLSQSVTAAAAATKPVNPGGDTSSQLNGVACPGATTCVAVGNNNDKTTLAEGWNGTKWAVQSTPGLSGSFDSLAGIACVTTGNCWAVGVSETSTGAATPVIEHWNGKSWSLTSG